MTRHLLGTYYVPDWSFLGHCTYKKMRTDIWTQATMEVLSQSPAGQPRSQPPSFWSPWAGTHAQPGPHRPRGGEAQPNRQASWRLPEKVHAVVVSNGIKNETGQ